MRAIYYETFDATETPSSFDAIVSITFYFRMMEQFNGYYSYSHFIVYEFHFCLKMWKINTISF